MQYPRIKSINIKGYRAFKDFSATLSDLEIIVGANGAGKTTLFEFLKLLRNGMTKAIYPEILAGSLGDNVFHVGGEEKIQWQLEIDLDENTSLRYLGEILGPVRAPQIAWERVEAMATFNEYQEPSILLDVKENSGKVGEKLEEEIITLPNELALSKIDNPAMVNLYKLREYIGGWKFYSSFNIAREKIREPVLIEPEPLLDDDCGNISSVLYYLMRQNPLLYQQLQQHLSSVVPGFDGLTVKAAENSEKLIAFWQEKGIEKNLTIADLSDGIMRLICWICLCLHPLPHPLICIDEPDEGVHPRTLPLMAGLLEKASKRSQIFLAVHSSYLLSQFDLSPIAVMRKKNGATQFIKPAKSPIILGMIEEFGIEEVEHLHRSNELELLP